MISAVMVLSDSRERRGKSSQWGFLRAWNTWELLTFSMLKVFLSKSRLLSQNCSFLLPSEPAVPCQGNGNSGRSWKHLMGVWRVGELHSWWAGLCFSLTLIEQNSPSAGAVNSATGINTDFCDIGTASFIISPLFWSTGLWLLANSSSRT